MSSKRREQERKKLKAKRKEVIRVASVNKSGSRIEHLANLMLIETLNKRIRKFKRGE